VIPESHPDSFIVANSILAPAGRNEMVDGQRILFDAGKYPAYAEAKEKGLRMGKLVMMVSMIGTPVVLAVLLVFIWMNPETDIDLAMMAGVVGAVIVADELLMYYVVGPSIRRRWQSPTVVTETELKFGTRSIPLAEIVKITIMDGSVNFSWKESGARFQEFLMFSDAEVGDPGEFVKVLSGRNPGLTIEDLRRRKAR